MNDAQIANPQIDRSLGVAGATSVGIGAIVGGGVLALAGVAFAQAGPAAIIAFAANGAIALITALSFAEMSTRFPESGGTYTFAKKVLSVESAFVVGWIVWFASLVAAMLYAVGFAAFAVDALHHIWLATGRDVPGWSSGRLAVAVLAAAATSIFAIGLACRGASGGSAINIGKLLVFGVLIAGGLAVLIGTPRTEVESALTPFFSNGWVGVISAMGFTFIAFQGFDLIAAVGGEVRNPRRTLPRAMIISLLAAMIVYLPLLFLVSTVGVVPGEHITTVAEANPETLVALAARNYLGGFGYWLVLIAGILAMLSALQANLMAASRVAFAMAVDRTLPRSIGTVNLRSGAPARAVGVGALAVIALIVILPDVASAGAAASLIFLITFAAAHWTAILARRRSEAGDDVFRTPLFPLVPVVGLVACVGLAVFQGVAVPSAGVIGVVWLGVGGILYIVLFARHARVVDASMEATDPHLLRLRGRSPMVLVPIANPANAASMVAVANALAPRHVGRVLLLSVITPPSPEDVASELPSPTIENAQRVLSEAMQASFARNLYPESLITVSVDPWKEIVRVAHDHQCGCVLVGLDMNEGADDAAMERLIGGLKTNVAVIRAPAGWHLDEARRVLVPVRGHTAHDALRVRLLASLQRMAARDVTYLRAVPSRSSDARIEAEQFQLADFAREESRGHVDALVAATDDVPEEIARQAATHDLVVLGLERQGRRNRLFGQVARSIARRTDAAIIMLSRYG